MRDTPHAVMMFAAGFGTRMRHLTKDQPKPMVRVAGRPLIGHALDLANGIAPERIVVNLHYKPDPLLRHLEGRDVQTIVQQQGAAILRYPSKRVQGMALYDRYVANSGWCEPGEWAKPGWVPTADRAKCPVRHCEDIDYWDDGRFRRY